MDEKKPGNYSVHINWTSSRPFNPEQEVVEVRMSRDGEIYSSNFATLKYLNYVFQKNARTGECASGTYFTMPNLVLVRKLTDKDIKATIDDLIANFEIDKVFEKI